MRRPFRRPRRPGGPFPAARRPAARAAMIRLQQANQLMARGEYQHAANLFAELADGAERRSIPRAAQLHLQAARALLQAGDKTAAVKRIKHSVDLFEKTGQQDKLARLAPRILHELREHGLEEDAVSLEVRLADLPRSSDTGDHGRAGGSLPSKCDSCGGSVRSDEVEWVDAHSAVCPYCGSVLQRE